MRFENPVKPPSLAHGDDALPVFRQWLMDGHDPDGAVEGQPLWAWLLDQGWFAAVDEALQAGANPNRRDRQGEGWLHRVIHTQAPSWLAIGGLRGLDAQWWRTNDMGMTPFHLPVFDDRLAQAMIARWRAEQRPWATLAHPFDPMEATLPQTPLWRAWRGLVRP